MKSMYIKLILTVLLAAAVWPVTLSGGVGIKVGMNSAHVGFSGADAGDWTAITTFRAGVFYNFKLGNRWRLQPEVYYTANGTTLDGTYGGQTLTSTLKLHYIEVPLLVKMEFPGKGKFRPGFFLGGYGAFNVGAKTFVEFAGETVEETITDDISKLDYGVVAGGGVAWGLGAGQLILDIRFTLGLKSIKRETFTDFSIKNRALTIMLGYCF